MRWNIINEIRHMESEHYYVYGKRGTTICLDANAEARITALLVLELSSDNCCFTCVSGNNPKEEVDDILDSGIRHLSMVIAGMDLKFDCPSFCIENTGQKWRMLANRVHFG